MRARSWVLLFAILGLAGAALAAEVDVRGEENRLEKGKTAEKLDALRRLKDAKDPEARAALRRQLRAQKRAAVRARIAEAMASPQDAEGKAELLRALRSDAALSVRESAAYSLGFTRGDDVVAALSVVFLDSREPLLLRLRALNSLSQQGAPALGTFARALEDSDPGIRRQALILLVGGYTRDAAEPLVRKAARDEDAKIKDLAESTLKEWTTKK